MSSIPRPDLSSRPLLVSCEHTVTAKPEKVYAAWTTRFDTWFAQAGTLAMVPEPGRPYFFYNRDEWGRHPHYGRVLDARESEFIEMTWMTQMELPRGQKEPRRFFGLSLFQGAQLLKSA